MGLDQLKERWLAELTRKKKKKRFYIEYLSKRSRHKVYQASKPSGIDPLDSTWRLGRGGAGGGGGGCFVYFSREPMFQP